MHLFSRTVGQLHRRRHPRCAGSSSKNASFSKEAGKMARKILEVNEMSAGFFVNKEILKATDRISFSVEEGQTLCIVGESGSGKSVTSLAVMRLIDYAGGMILEGDIKFNGEVLSEKDQDEMRSIRGNQIAMIFQDPMSSLNPVFTVGEQIAESLRLHQRKSPKDAMKMAIDLLREVGIPSPEVRARQYPHELSGGMCQRVVIAIALACRPELLIADEPTTALDVTVQAQILDLLQQLQRETGMSIVLITHDMGVAAEVADRIVVMYAGGIMEEGSVEEIFSKPSHPYTVGLLKSIPGFEAKTEEDLYTIKGNIPRINQLPGGCRFHPRCPHAMDICRREEPGFFQLGNDHKAACWLFEEHSDESPLSPRINIGSQGEVTV
ncbi:Oligopeptide transport ATP-binding protein AppD [Paenibacillus sp. P22]|nr:Oligopeptide transport ATP-binding protein AppD [Paenibacillus sp. P22]